VSSTDNLHSQLVGWAKIILPLCALGLLSTLFLFARNSNEPSEIVLAEVEAIAREQLLSAPEFSGVTDDGAIVVISARTARPNDVRPDTVDVDDMKMRMDNTDGSQIFVTALEGELDGRGRIGQFFGLVHIETSTGYQMETNGLVAELDTGLVTSDTQIEIRAPFGELSAGSARFLITSENTGQEMLFTNGVRLLYRPQDP
jgi:lipopolysaccharide export system protein LptC